MARCSTPSPSIPSSASDRAPSSPPPLDLQPAEAAERLEFPGAQTSRAEAGQRRPGGRGAELRTDVMGRSARPLARAGGHAGALVPRTPGQPGRPARRASAPAWRSWRRSACATAGWRCARRHGADAAAQASAGRPPDATAPSELRRSAPRRSGCSSPCCHPGWRTGRMGRARWFDQHHARSRSCGAHSAGGRRRCIPAGGSCRSADGTDEQC